MTISERNVLFEENMKWIQFVINKNRSLIYALRLDVEDVSQCLAICVLKAIETFDPARGAKLSTYIVYKLQFEILNIRQQVNRDCRSANTTAFSLDYSAFDDDENTTVDIPDIVDFHSGLIVEEIYNRLSENEREVLNLRLNNVGLQNKRQARLMDRVKKKVTRFYALPAR